MNATTGKALELTLDQALAAGYPLVYVATWDEERLADSLRQEGKGTQESPPVWRWTAADGFRDGPGRDRDLRDPEQAIAFAASEGAGARCLMLDLPAWFATRPGLARALRNAYDRLAGKAGGLVLCHPNVHIPAELENEIVLATLPPLQPNEVRALLGRLNDGLDSELRQPPAWLDACAEVMHGLTTAEIRDLFRHATRTGAGAEEAEALVRQTRAQRLQKEACLEVIETRFDLDQVGGLNRLKQWILSRHELFSERARAAGVDPPSGVLMMGVSGCGKSLAAKVIPNAWQLPLVRLDMNRVMSGARGSPEEAWQRALRTAEAAAPIVLWIDEIENSFGYQDGKTASGNMTIFSSFLTWMQEKPSDVFVVATANRIEMLPAEMLRKGRFDQLFFLDLPDEEARIEILRVHITAEGGDPEQFDLLHLAGLVDGWTAAEIEQVVRAARTDAFYEDRPFNYDDLMKNSFRMVPLSRTMSEQIEALRRWSHKRATPAD